MCNCLAIQLYKKYRKVSEFVLETRTCQTLHQYHMGVNLISYLGK